MILQDTILVSLHGINSKYYESLGYFIQRYLYTKNYQKVWIIKKGTMLEVKVSDLPKGSNIKVLCKCDECGKENLVIYQNLKNLLKYICIKCIRKSNDFKEKISKTSKGRTHSPETRDKISKGHFLTAKYGKDNHNWNFNLSEEERKSRHNISGISTWKRKVKERDNYTCQCCGYVGKKNDGIVESHHINNFSDFKEQRTDIKNGITLCKDCHKSLHKAFGKKTIREDFEKFKKEYLSCIFQ